MTSIQRFFLPQKKTPHPKVLKIRNSVPVGQACPTCAQRAVTRAGSFGKYWSTTVMETATAIGTCCLALFTAVLAAATFYIAWEVYWFSLNWAQAQFG
jgi:hypothetical protein